MLGIRIESPIAKFTKIELLMSFINLVTVLICVFLPTSRHTEIYDSDRLVLVWALLILELVFIANLNFFNKSLAIKNLFFFNMYMIFVTILYSVQNSFARFSIARFAPIVTLLFLFCIRIRYYPRINFMKFLLNFISFIAMIWNLFIILGFQPVLDFTYNNYNQYYSLSGYYQVILYHKPIMSFGVHSYASFFYFLLFLCCVATYEIESKKTYLLYSFMYTFYCLMLTSSSSIVYFTIMFFILLKIMIQKLTVNKLMLCVFLIATFFFVIVFNYNILYDRLYANVFGGNNGFLARYFSDETVFDSNLDIVTTTLGIGYNIVDNLAIRYTDSGYLVYLTMGNIPLAFSIYYSLYKFIADNFLIYKALISFVIFSFELALPATFNYRFSYMMIFLVCYFGALYQSTLRKTE